MSDRDLVLDLKPVSYHVRHPWNVWVWKYVHAPRALPPDPPPQWPHG